MWHANARLDTVLYTPRFMMANGEVKAVTAARAWTDVHATPSTRRATWERRKPGHRLPDDAVICKKVSGSLTVPNHYIAKAVRVTSAMLACIARQHGRDNMGHSSRYVAATQLVTAPDTLLVITT